MGLPLYIRPPSVSEALLALAQRAGDVCVLAGGTDLLVSIRRRQVDPGAVVDITGIDELRVLRFNEDGGVFLGATVTHARVVEEATLVQGREALVDACGEVGSWQIRNVATIGGNLCNGSPAAETASPFLVLGAKIRLVGSDGHRELDLEDFFIAPGHTGLRSGELLTDVMLPNVPSDGASAYVRVSPRRAMDIAVAGAAAYVEIDAESAECNACRIALTGVAPTPVRVREAEAAVVGSPVEARTTGVAGAIAGASAVCTPIDDQRASCEYRRAVVPALVSRALLLAGARVQGRRR